MRSNSYYYEYHLVSRVLHGDEIIESNTYWHKYSARIRPHLLCSALYRKSFTLPAVTTHPFVTPCMNHLRRIWRVQAKSLLLSYYHCFFGFFFPQIVSQVFKKLNWSTLVGRKNFFLSKTRGILAARKLKISVNHVEGLLVLNPMAEKITYIGLRLFWNTLSWFSMYFKFVEDTFFIGRNGVVVNPAGTRSHQCHSLCKIAGFMFT